MIHPDEIERIYQEMFELDEKRDAERRLEIRRVRRMIDYPFRWIGNILRDNTWGSEGIVSAVLTTETSSGYREYQHYRIQEDGNLVMRQDEYKNFHTLVIQWSIGCEGDSYSGFLYFPLKDGRYWKVSYSC